ncbi:MAG: 50S ribosomal protein L2 [Gemmatimonas sp.]|nr:50S ribosomal protein L2 [Gemmatimonas sp.]
MAIKQFKPMTPGTRFRAISESLEVTRKGPEKSLVEALPQKGGRNHHGHITMRRRGGRHKRKYRVIDFKRNKFGVPARVIAIEYDPNRSANIALVEYNDGERRYILHPAGLEVGHSVVSGPGSDVRTGNAMPLSEIPLGTTVHNIELRSGAGGKMARSAGAGVQIVAKEGQFVTLRMPSSEMRMVRRECMATVGQVGNIDHNKQSVGKAGANRWRGKRPKVRGVVMNPVDHPLGGGEGRSSGGRHPVSPWGLKDGVKTRKAKKASTRLIVRGRKRGKATQ